jgi:hypothetical protein
MSIAQGKPGLPRKANSRKYKYQNISGLQNAKSLLRGKPGLPPKTNH